MSISYEEYRQAKYIVDAYEAEQQKLLELRHIEFKKDLQQYFETTLIDNSYKLKRYRLSYNHYIMPMEPDMEECYEGGNDDDIKKLCEKHEVYYRFPSWVYPK